MHRPVKTAHGGSLVARAMLTTLFVTLRAQQPPARSSAPSPAPKPLVPVATKTIAANPDADYGQVTFATFDTAMMNRGVRADPERQRQHDGADRPLARDREGSANENSFRRDMSVPFNVGRPDAPARAALSWESRTR